MTSIFRYLLLSSAFAGGLFAGALLSDASPKFDPPDSPIMVIPDGPRETRSGDYLISRFAQAHQDWDQASKALANLREDDPENESFLRRQMVLAMGSGNVENALDLAKNVKDSDPANPLALMFLAVDMIKHDQYAQALDKMKDIDDGEMSGFILPLLKSWARAGEGKLDIVALSHHPIHLYHAIYISDYLKDYGALNAMLDDFLQKDTMTDQGREQVADIYAHTKQYDKALKLYKDVLQNSENQSESVKNNLKDKIEKAKNHEDMHLFDRIDDAKEGTAVALFDMAESLANDYNADSGRVFAQMALYLDPKLAPAHILLAQIASDYKRYDQALAEFQKIDPEDPHYIDAQLAAADILEDAKRYDEALGILSHLDKEYGNFEAVVRQGDLYRHREDYANALKSYNQAFDRLGQKVPDQYWYLYYVRGMVNERLGNWTQAESDLKEALSYQPDHPYLLNYLGYAWADQDMHLDQALAMIEKASALRPEDGYITDSLGWVLFRMDQYERAVPELERAVELLPYDPVINDHLGDAYWKVGRTLEARFQWQRAKNYSEDTKLIDQIKHKIVYGLNDADGADAGKTKAAALDSRAQ